MTELINTIGRKTVAVKKDQDFIEGDVITFVFAEENKELMNITQNNLIGLIRKVEGRYVTLWFSIEPIVDGEVKQMNLNRSIVIKMNGFAAVSLLEENGVASVELPLADVVNMAPSIIIKNMLERPEPTRDELIELAKKSVWSMGKTQEEIEAMVDESIAENKK